ncbi:MAG: hypothetical protein EA425_13930 [Puniceicoccaceae bacterium]|nr:MAG: hypothetical protein EA425_13930 [Puniceicoccaceae bacterium]
MPVYPDPYPKVGDPDRPTGGRINVSGFAFRDFNRNGVYDDRDHSLAGVYFRLVNTTVLNLQGPVNSLAATNRGGWANFVMSASQSGAHIRSPGTYTLIAIPPPGLVVSTANEVQEFTVTALPGALGDLTMDRMPKPVGFMPELWIRGTLPPGAEVTIEPADSGSAPEAHDAEPFAEAPSFQTGIDTPGVYLLRQTFDGRQLERRIEVGRFPVVVSEIRDVSRQEELVERREEALTFSIDFEELIPGIEARKVPSVYRGLQWDNITAMHDKFSNANGYHNVTASGHFLAYTSSGQPGTISRDEPFDFLGGVFGIGRHQRHGEYAMIRGYRGDELIYEDTFPLSAYFATWFQADYLGITKLVLTTTHRWQLAMDDLSFRLPRSAPELAHN